MSIGSHVVRPVGNALAMASIVSLMLTPAIPVFAEEGGASMNQAALTTSQSNSNVALRKREAVTAVTSRYRDYTGVLCEHRCPSLVL